VQRSIPEGSGLPPDGYLLNPKGMPKPLNCSWCDLDYVFDIEGLVLCPDCDLYDRRKGEA
jgi:hypothetical protein